MTSASLSLPHFAARAASTALGIGLAFALLSARATRAQDGLAPATPLAESDTSSVRPTSINDDGRITGTRIRPLPPLANCNPMCERGRLSGATEGFLTRAGAPLELVAGQRPVAISRTHVVLQESGGPASPPTAARLIHLQTGEVIYTPSYGGRGCLLRDIDERGRILCGLTDGTVLPATARTSSYLVDIATKAVTPLLCPPSVSPYACIAVAMNDAGLIVGMASGPAVWRGYDDVTPLPTSPRFREIHVVAVNERGTILGGAEDRERKRWVVYWDATTRALNIVGEGVGLAINDHDVIAGYKMVHYDLDPDLDGPVPGGVERAYEPRATLFDLRSGRAISLPGVTGDERASEAFDINNEGVAIGRVDARGVVFDAYH